MAEDRLDAIVQANARLVRRVMELEDRVVQLERRAGIAPVPVTPIEPPATAPVVTPPPRPQPPPLPKAAVPPPLPVQEPALETRLGLTWINRIAVVTCVFAVAFFFKYAADANWIGPGMRVAVGLLTAAVALVAAELLFRRGHATYAQGITALSIGIFYLSIYAAFDFYQLLGAAPAFICMTAITALSGYFAVRHRAMPIAILGLIGGFLTPLLLSTGEKQYGFLLSYLFVLSAAAMYVARREGWRALEFCAVIGSGSLYVGVLDTRAADRPFLPLRLFALGYYALFATSTHWVVFFIAHLLVTASFRDVLPSDGQAFTVCLSLASAAALVLSGIRRWQFGPLAALLSFLLSWSLCPAKLDATTTIVFYTLNYLIFISWIPIRLLYFGAKASTLDLLVATSAAILYFAGVYSQLETINANTIAFVAYLLAALHGAVAYWQYTGQRAESRQDAPIQLYAVIAAALVTLAIPLQFSGFSATMGWSLEATALAWLSHRSNEKLARIASIAVFAISLTYLFLHEARDYPLLAFVVSAICLGVSSMWYAPAELQLMTYSSAHLVMLSGLILETVQWARGQAAESVSTVTTFSVTAVIALYSIACVGSGVAFRHSITRILGLAFIAVVILKVYLYDVWTLPILYRVIAFASLGALLLAMSFLYSKYRSSLEKFIQNDPSS